MVTLVKHEWHQVDSQFEIEIDEDVLSEIYPELNKKELKKLLKSIADGSYSVEDVIDEAYNQGVDLEWDRVYDDWWTERKGGYDVTYNVKD